MVRPANPPAGGTVTYNWSVTGNGTISGSNFRVTFGADTDAVSDTDCRTFGYNPATDASTGDHATHAAGTVVGNGSQSAGVASPLLYRGMAPNAEIVAYVAPNLDTNLDGIAEAAPVGTHAAQYAGAKGLGMALSTRAG